MKTLVLALLALVAAAAAAAEPDPEIIARITGLQPDVKNGVAKVSLPRTDLAVTADGIRLVPFQGLTSWAAFVSDGTASMVMGDLTLLEDEVTSAMRAALDGNLEVTALHNHFAFDHPRVLFMHIGGTGTTEALATGVRKALDAVREVRRTPTPASGFGGPGIPAESHIVAAPLEAILGGHASEKDGMVKFVFGRVTDMHGLSVGPEMGVNTWAVFAGSPEAAVVDGDVAMHESELQSVLKALVHAGIHVVAIHSHMTHEEPRILFLHYWGKGRAEELARALAAALPR